MTYEDQHGMNSEAAAAPGVVTPEQLARSVSSYLADAEANPDLGPQSLTLFKALQGCFENGLRGGYIELPTDIGNPMLFLELTKALRNTPQGAPTPRILVVAPTQDVLQRTLEKSGTKGFDGSASELTVVPLYKGSTTEDRETFTTAGVGVTTGLSFQQLPRTPDFVPARELGAEAIAAAYRDRVESFASGAKKRNWSPEATLRNSQKVAQEYLNDRFRGLFVGEPMLSKFDVIILDEGEHAPRGTAARDLTRYLLSQNKVVIGLTAKPDAAEGQKLSEVLLEKIHHVSLSEAIDMRLLSPIVPIAIVSGMRVKGLDVFNASGEYKDDAISYLARSTVRNDRILDAAEVFASNGVGTIISCIAGDNSRHARVLAESLRDRGTSAGAVYNDMSPDERAALYQQFELGVLAVLTVDEPSKGWDTQRAKALINARPTRYPSIATQRSVRVAQPGGVTYAVDILDEHENGISPVGVVDLLTDTQATYGQAFGAVSEAERANIDTLLRDLSAVTSTMTDMHTAYYHYQNMLAELPKLTGGKTVIDGRVWVVPSKISAIYSGVTEEILIKAAEVHAVTLTQIKANMNGLMRLASERHESEELLHRLPVVDPQKYYIDKDDLAKTKWASSAGLAKLFGSHYPGVSAADIDEALRFVADESLSWVPALARIDRSGLTERSFRALRLYEVSRETPRGLGTLSGINTALQQYYATNP